MAASLVGTPQTTDYGFSDTRDAVTIPSGVQNNDVIFFVLATANTHTLGTLPSGVSQLGTTQDSDAGGDSSTSVLYRISDGTEGATFDLGAIFAAAESGGVLAFAYRGLDTTDLVEGVNQASTTGTAISGPSVTPANDNCLILQIAGTDPSTEPVFTPDSSPAATDVFSGYIDTGLWGYVAVQSYDQASAAAIALDGTFDLSYNWAHFQVALNTVATTTAGISSKTLERLGVTVSATAADVFVWSGHDVDMVTTAADHKVLGATITSGVLQEIDLSSTGIAVSGNITVVVIPATGGPGIAIETTAEDIA